MTAVQSAGTTRCAIAFQFLTTAARSMVSTPPVSSSAGPDASIWCGAGATTAGLATADMAGTGLVTAALATTDWPAVAWVGKPADAAADVSTDGARAELNFAFNLPNVKGASP